MSCRRNTSSSVRGLETQQVHVEQHGRVDYGHSNVKIKTEGRFRGGAIPYGTSDRASAVLAVHTSKSRVLESIATINTSRERILDRASISSS